MPTEDPQLSLQHVGNGTPCRYFNHYNGECLSGSSCAYSHAPDDNSLRLKLDGGNICEAHLVRIGGCAMGHRCWYSHDLENGASFPVDDAWAMKDVLERIIRMRKDERRKPGFQGDFLVARGEGPSCLEFANGEKGGDILLRELGGRRPQGGSVRHPHGQAWKHQQPLNPGEEDEPMSEEMKAMFAPAPSRGAPSPRRGGPSHRTPPRARRPPSDSDLANDYTDDMAMYGRKPGDWASPGISLSAVDFY